MHLPSVLTNFMVDSFNIDVFYASEDGITIKHCEVKMGCTIGQAIEASQILQHCQEIDLSKNPVGVFSQKRSLDELVAPGDRIEIYRPLKIDPKQARRTRAIKS